MKKLSDYKGDEAIELWADLLEPLTVILGDKELLAQVKDKAPLIIAKEILKSHKQEAVEILVRIDPEPLDGMNILIRMMLLLADIGNNKEIMSFFGSAPQAMSESESFGSAMESTEDGEK